MENKIYSVLIIEDHPLISEAYKSAFNTYSKQNENISFAIEEANNCDSGFALISDFSKRKKHLDIVFLDIKLPSSKDNKILSGEDLGLKINTLSPNTKVLISTMFNDNYRIHSIFKNLNPEGFLIKNDITSNDLLEAIHILLNDSPYYSKSVIKLLRKEVTNDLLLDYLDRKILYELSIGTLMKDLPEVLPLSMAGIEKRKRHLKNIFNIKSGNDKELIFLAKDKGFI
ncbi:MAG: response regulator [Polaribacter sp.]